MSKLYRGSIDVVVAIGATVLAILVSLGMEMQSRQLKKETTGQINQQESYYAGEMAAWQSYYRFVAGDAALGTPDAEGRYAIPLTNDYKVNVGGSATAYAPASYQDGTPLNVLRTSQFDAATSTMRRFEPGKLMLEKENALGPAFCGTMQFGTKNYRTCLAFADTNPCLKSVPLAMPKIKWRSQVVNAPLTYTSSVTTPLAADINRDGITDFIAVTYQNYGDYGKLRVFNGQNGVEFSQINISEDVGHSSIPAIVDVDRDGYPEILSSGWSTSIGSGRGCKHAVYMHGWTGPAGNKTASWGLLSTAIVGGNGKCAPTLNPWVKGDDQYIVVADVNFDGLVDVFVNGYHLRANANRTLTQVRIWPGAGKADYYGGLGVMQVDNDPQLEIVDGFARRIYDPVTGVMQSNLDVDPARTTLNWIRGRVGGVPTESRVNFLGFGDWNNDGIAEIVSYGGGYLKIFNSANPPVLSTSVSINPSTDAGSQFAIADLDADNIPEIIAGYSGQFRAYRSNGTLYWNADLPVNHYMKSTGAAVADLNGDKIPEVIVTTANSVRMYNGKTGALVWNSGAGQHTAVNIAETPVIVSLEVGKPAVFAVSVNSPAGASIAVWESQDNSWLPMRTVWNQSPYLIPLIRDDLTTPTTALSASDFGGEKNGMQKQICRAP